MNNNKYLLSAASAYFIWGFFSFGLKPISNYASIDILCYRLFLCSVILIIVSLLFRKQKIRKDIATFRSISNKFSFLARLIGGALILMLNWLAFIYVMNQVSVQTAGLSYLICPILTTLLGYLILKEKLSKEKWIAIIISTISCCILSYGHFRELYLSLFVAAAFAFYLIVQRKLNVIDPFNLLTIQTTLIAIILLPIFLIFKGPTPQSINFYNYIILIVGLFTILPMFLNNYALKGINSSTAGILIYLNPLVNFFWAMFYYKEHFTNIQIISYLLIFISIIIYNSRLLFKRNNNIES